MENHKKECKHGKQQQEIEDRIREEQERNRGDDRRHRPSRSNRLHSNRIVFERD